MYTRCPHCQTYFKISADQLKKAGGKVRCGQCSKVFNSLGNLLEQLPVSLSQKAPPPKPKPVVTPVTPRPVSAAPKPRVAPPISPRPPTPPPKPASPPRRAPDTSHAETKIDAPNFSFERPEAPEAPIFNDDIVFEEPTGVAQSDTLDLSGDDRVEDIQVGPFSSVRDLVLYPGPRVDVPTGLFGNAFWGTGVAVLLVVFVFQYSYYMRDDLARYPELRPFIQKLCEFARCELPMQQNVDLIKLTHRDITSHPRVKGALLINAVVVNNATFAQPFPVMQITLSDINGQVIAKRRFQPVEYLDADINLRRGMPPNSPIQIVLEIADPGKDAVNFEFNFFYQNS